jgi:hypothetical protein
MMPPPGWARSDECAFRIDPTTGAAEPLVESELASFGFWERRDLQRWIVDRPEIVEADLLLITTEFDRWQGRDQVVADRLDVLFLDSDGRLLVAELKRGEAPDTTHLQALKYAAYCSQLTVADVIEEYMRTHSVDREKARADVLEHAPALETKELGRIRIRLVAEHFGPSVTHVVMWLRDYDLLTEVGFPRPSIAGPQCWIDENGRSLAELAYEIEPRRQTDNIDPLSVIDLITAGVLVPGTRVRPKRDDHKGEGMIRHDGTIEIDGRALSPTAASNRVGGSGRGWDFWAVQTQSSGLQTLAEIRRQLNRARDTLTDG